jgi:hypothetical protein
MKKNYVKPVASNIAFVMNENIATSGYDVIEGHIKYTADNTLGDTCNKYFGNTYIPSELSTALELNSFDMLVQSTIAIRKSLGDAEFAALTQQIEDGTITCWAL